MRVTAEQVINVFATSPAISLLLTWSCQTYANSYSQIASGLLFGGVIRDLIIPLSHIGPGNLQGIIPGNVLDWVSFTH